MSAGPERRLMRVALGLWTLFILYGSFIPFTFTAHAGALPESLAQIQWRLFEEGQRAFSVPDVLSNVLLFAPFGFLAVGARLKPAPSAAATAAGVVGLATLLAAMIEVGQLFAPGRVSSLIDVAANGTGALLGVMAASATHGAIDGRLGASVRRLVRAIPEVLPLALLVAALAARSFYPFAITLDVGTVWASLEHAQSAPLASLATAGWGDLLVGRGLPFALVAFLALRALGRVGAAGPRRSAWLLVAGLAVALELGKLGFVGRRPNIDHAILGALGAFAGVTALPALAGARAVRARPAAWLLALALLVLVHAELAPYDWRAAPGWVAAKIRRIEWMPLGGYFHAEPERALFDLWEKTLRSGFVGYAAAALAGGGLAASLAVGLAAGLLLEAAQLATATRVPSVTDVLIIALGAHGGGAAWRWYRRWGEDGARPGEGATR
jgi:VanZ family protein